MSDGSYTHGEHSIMYRVVTETELQRPNLEDMWLLNKPQKDKYSMIPLTWGIKFIERENGMVVSKSWAEGKNVELLLMGLVWVMQDKKVPKIGCQQYKYI